MRATRAILASLGTGMSLVLAGVVLLAAVSTVVAFNGWPGSTDLATQTPAAMLADAATPAAAERVSAPAALVVPEAPRPVRQAVRRASEDPIATGSPAQDATLAPQSSSSGSSGAATGAAPLAAGDGGDPSGTSSAPAPRPAGGTESVREAGAGLGGALDETVGDVGTSLAPVSPTLGQATDDIGRIVGDTVQGVTNTVADVLDGLLQPAG